jgi:hypothetical protein
LLEHPLFRFQGNDVDRKPLVHLQFKDPFSEHFDYLVHILDIDSRAEIDTRGVISVGKGKRGTRVALPDERTELLQGAPYPRVPLAYTPCTHGTSPPCTNDF